MILSRAELNFGLMLLMIHGGPIPDDIYNYDYNDDGLDHSVRGAEIFPEIRELKNLLVILRCKRLRNNSNFLKRNL